MRLKQILRWIGSCLTILGMLVFGLHFLLITADIPIVLTKFDMMVHFMILATIVIISIMNAVVDYLTKTKRYAVFAFAIMSALYWGVE